MEYDATGKCGMCNMTLVRIEERKIHLYNKDNQLSNNLHEHKENMHNNHTAHHKQMVLDFKKRFIISTLVTIPLLVLFPLIQQLLNFSFDFSGDKYVLVILSSFIFFYGGMHFLKGFLRNLTKNNRYDDSYRLSHIGIIHL